MNPDLHVSEFIIDVSHKSHHHTGCFSLAFGRKDRYLHHISITIYPPEAILINNVKVYR